MDSTHPVGMQHPGAAPSPRRMGVRLRLRRLMRTMGASLATVAALFGFAVFYGLWSSLPSVDASTLAAEQSARVLDRAGTEIYRIVGEEDRTALPWDQIPAHVKYAFIAVEDERFYERGCVDPQAILRAVVANMHGKAVQGGSTITQQLARNIYLTPERTYTRKLRELMIACRLESKLSKDEILHLYLDWIPFGHGAFGLERASRQYFGIPARDLTLAQAVVLASLPQRPTYFSPYGAHLHTSLTPDAQARLLSGTLTINALQPQDVEIGLLSASVRTASGMAVVGGRTDQVLENMQRQGYLPPEVRAQAELELTTLTFRPRGTQIDAPHFVLWVRDELARMQERQRDRGWAGSGLAVRTTLDPRLQAAAQDTADRVFPELAKKYKATNMALVAVDRRTREVLAYVGNTDYFDDAAKGKIDMARSPRQPGSSFKPIVYASYFKKGKDPNAIIWDTPLTIGKDRPKNYEGGFWGPVTIRKALAGSRNIPAIRAFQGAGGEEPVLQTAASLGITTPWKRKEQARKDGAPFDFGWPMAIGSAEIPLIEMVQAYATLADGGQFKPLVTIADIQDREGKVLYEPGRSAAPQRVLDERIAQDITSILSDAASRPGGWWRTQLTLPGNQQAAVKTGTSNLCLKRSAKGGCAVYGVNNVWTMGYTPDLVVGVWVGNADNTAMTPKADGLSVAAPLWKDFLVAAQAIRPSALAFDLPLATKRAAPRAKPGAIARDVGPVIPKPAWLGAM